MKLRRAVIWLRAWRHPRRGLGYPVTCFAFGHDARMADVETGRVRCARCGTPTRGKGWSLEAAHHTNVSESE